jgi:hypothetical protein
MHCRGCGNGRKEHLENARLGWGFLYCIVGIWEGAHTYLPFDTRNEPSVADHNLVRQLQRENMKFVPFMCIYGICSGSTGRLHELAEAQSCQVLISESSASRAPQPRLPADLFVSDAPTSHPPLLPESPLTQPLSPNNSHSNVNNQPSRSSNPINILPPFLRRRLQQPHLHLLVEHQHE